LKQYLPIDELIKMSNELTSLLKEEIK